MFLARFAEPTFNDASESLLSTRREREVSAVLAEADEVEEKVRAW